MSELVLRQAGFSELAYQFGRFIHRLNHGDDELIGITAALLSEAVSQGHVCLNLAITPSLGLDVPATKEWFKRLQKSSVVGSEGENKPLILTEDGLLYLYRHWQEEQQIADAIFQRCQPIPLNNKEQLQHDFSEWQSDAIGIDWQKIAVLIALTRQFSVISGGPGTGKTTIVLRLLKMLKSQNADLVIALAAPTGKAAARLQQAISHNGQVTLEAKTLHRLLGITATNEQGRYDRQQPLAIDVLIIDEASMIDISLMAIVMRALPEHARLVLLGDSQQLASVESGAVLANLCAEKPAFSSSFTDSVYQLTGISLPVSEKVPVLTDSIVTLQHSYRFNDSSDIGQLAKAVQGGELTTVFNVLETAEIPIWQQEFTPEDIENNVMASYSAYFDAVNNYAEATVCTALFEKHRVLCALKQGPQSVATVNYLIEKQLNKQGWKTQQTFYPGRPIMVTKNDYRQRLFNGDTGLILYNPQGVLRACFTTDEHVRWIDLNRLPAHETAFAITIHKSQGSEFDKVTVLLPEEDNILLNRSLLYTAITRARKQLMIMCSDARLSKTVQTQHQRETGLGKLINKR